MRLRRRGGISGGRADRDERLILVYNLLKQSAYYSWIFCI
jgi:hypothetical protein